MSDHWSAAYVGMPYAQADCAQLAALAARDVFGLDVTLPAARPELWGASRQLAALLDDYAAPVPAPHDGCLVLMRQGALWHVGTYCEIGGEGYVLHALRSTGSAVLTRVRDLPLLGFRVEGFYRWRGVDG